MPTDWMGDKCVGAMRSAWSAGNRTSEDTYVGIGGVCDISTLCSSDAIEPLTAMLPAHWRREIARPRTPPPPGVLRCQLGLLSSLAHRHRQLHIRTRRIPLGGRLRHTLPRLEPILLVGRPPALRRPRHGRGNGYCTGTARRAYSPSPRHGSLDPGRAPSDSQATTLRRSQGRVGGTRCTVQTAPGTTFSRSTGETRTTTTAPRESARYAQAPSGSQ